MVDGTTFGSKKYAKKVWEEYGLRPYEESADRPKKAKSAKGGKGKGGKGKKGGKGGKSPNKKRAYSAQWAKDSSDEESPVEDSDQEWSSEEGAEDAEDQYWSEGRTVDHKRAKRSKETSALDDLFY